MFADLESLIQLLKIQELYKFYLTSKSLSADNISCLSFSLISSNLNDRIGYDTNRFCAKWL